MPSSNSPINWQRLRQEADRARSCAYAPYSKYSVGAALQTSRGEVFGGANVENASYGLSICAERSAIFAMVTAGSRDPVALLVRTEDGGTPCGACRQVLYEFGGANLAIRCVGDGHEMEYLLSELLPHAFALNPT